jgi:hypothetical protein
VAADDDALSAGEFGAWLDDARAALRGERDAEVPCGGCTACCESRQFVHIEPDELGAIAAIPVELLFPAPGMPRGHLVLPYDEEGRCPMLVDGGCSVYDHRPRTCRAYDCRVFAAVGVQPEGPLVAARTRRWRFTGGGARRAAVAAEASALLAAGASPTEAAIKAIDRS